MYYRLKSFFFNKALFTFTKNRNAKNDSFTTLFNFDSSRFAIREKCESSDRLLLLCVHARKTAHGNIYEKHENEISRSLRNITPIDEWSLLLSSGSIYD